MERLLLLLAIFHVGCVMCNVDCDCDYHAGGCTISAAAPRGFKCRCSYKGGWTCSGTAFPCVDNEYCPGNEADYCACKLGRGDCDGYVRPDKSCGRYARSIGDIPSTGNCDCNYHPGGCSISSPAPFGWKCVCKYKGAWTCGGWAQRCAHNEICLGNDYSYCGCKQGGGDCDAYRDKPNNCPSTHFSPSCDCNKAADWNRGFYDITGITYAVNNANIEPLELIAVAEKDVPNHSSQTQSSTFKVTESLAFTSSYSHTEGVQVQVGTKFTAGIPLIGEAETSITVTGSYSHTYGESTTITKTYEGSFTCNGAPHKHTKCIITMQKVRMNVPYTMNVRHKVVPGCSCESKGVWTGVQAYKATLQARETPL